MIRHFHLLAICPLMASLQAQIVTIGSDVSCPTCVVEKHAVLRLSGPEISGPVSTIARDERGRLFAVDRTDGILRMYGSDGRLVRQIGRHGAGPGEYEQIRNVLVDSAGNIHVVDGVLGRRSEYDPTGKFRTSAQGITQGGFGRPILLAEDGQMIINGIGHTIDDVGYSLQRVDKSGATTGLFDEAAYSAERPWQQDRILAGRRNGRFWVGNPYAFTFDLYAADLKKTLSIVRRADWLPPLKTDDRLSDGVWDRPYTPQIRASWEDADGNLWVLYYVPSPEWKPGPRLPTPAQMRASGPPAAEQTSRPRLNTVIEVIDLKRNVVLARTRFRDPVGLVFGSGYVARTVYDQGGEPSIEISALILKH